MVNKIFWIIGNPRNIVVKYLGVQQANCIAIGSLRGKYQNIITIVDDFGLERTDSISEQLSRTICSTISLIVAYFLARISKQSYCN